MSQFDSYLNHDRTERLVHGCCRAFPSIYIPLDIIQLIFMFFNELIYCKLYEKDIAETGSDKLTYWWMYRKPNLDVPHNYMITQVT